MSLPGLAILAPAAGFIAGVLTSLFAWIVPLRVEREAWRKLAQDAERQRAWEADYTADGYRRRVRVERMFGRRERDAERN